MSVPPEDQPRRADYRFTLANERTFLAWVRTSLAFVAGGIAVSELVSGAHLLREVLALVLVACGGLGAVLSYRRWRSIETTMRSGDPLPTSPLPRAVALVLVVVAAVTVVLVLDATGR
jgi:putative membrane protein